MLLKLIKYEILYSMRKMLPLYAGCILLSFTLGFNVNYISNAIVLRVLFPILFIFFFGGVILMNVFIIIMRFYNNLFSREGYLMHTLPVSTEKLVATKLLVSLLWVVSSIVVITISVLIIVSGVEGTDIFTSLYKAVFSKIDLLPTITLNIITIIVDVLANILFTYMIISMANSKLLIKNTKVAGGLYIVLFWIITSYIESSVFKLLFNVEDISRGVGDFIATNFVGVGMASAGLNLANSTVTMVNRVLLGSIALKLLFVIIYYFVTVYFMKNHLNLE